MLSFLNGSTLVSFMFGYLYPRLPAGGGAIKGLMFGMLAWVVMGLAFFPLIGLGVFAANLKLGIWPALFSLAMLLTYSVVMGIVFAALNSRICRSPRRGPIPMMHLAGDAAHRQK